MSTSRADSRVASRQGAPVSRCIASSAISEPSMPHAGPSVVSTSDSQTPGAIAALKAAKVDPMFVSFDAQPASVKAIEAGDILDADSGWSGRTIGADAVKSAVKAARGEQLPPAHIIPVTVVDKSNASSWKG